MSAVDGDEVPDVRTRSPLARLTAWPGPPAGYQLMRWLILRLLGLVYVFAFLGLIAQGPALFGEHGLTPVRTHLEQLAGAGMTGWDVPSILWWDSSDGAMAIWAWIGLALSLALARVLVWMPVFGSAAAPTQIGLGVALLALAGGAAWWWRRVVVSPGAPLDGWQLAVGCFAALAAIKSVPVIANLASSNQAMNHAYDRLDLVNTYGAFGSVGDIRYELVIEGTRDPDPETATWRAYELPCKPGDLTRRPCLLGPYHRRLDWLIWFAAMPDKLRDPWVVHLVYKLLDGDRSIRELLADDPFDGAAPTWVRIRRFVYHLEPIGAETWWSRDREQLWLEPVSLETPGLREAIEPFGWPSPSLR